MARKRRNYQDEEMEYQEIVNHFIPTQPILAKYKIQIEPKTENQKLLLQLIKDKEIVICSGPAGTGKTFLACVQALQLYKENLNFRKIILVKSVTTLKDEEIGYLKGTLEEKMEPFVYSFFHNFEKIIPKNVINNLKDSKSIEILPIAFMRGINLDNCVVIIDECQNITPDNMRTIMTRIGTNCKMIFLGDEGQIDLKHKRNSSLQLIMDKFAGFDEIGCMRFTEEDTVRNPIIRKIEEVFRSISGPTA